MGPVSVARVQCGKWAERTLISCKREPQTSPSAPGGWVGIAVPDVFPRFAERCSSDKAYSSPCTGENDPGPHVGLPSRLWSLTSRDGHSPIAASA